MSNCSVCWRQYSTVPTLSLSIEQPNYIKSVISNKGLKSVSISKTPVFSNFFIHFRQRCVCSSTQRELTNHDGKWPQKLEDCKVIGVLASRATTGRYTAVAGRMARDWKKPLSTTNMTRVHTLKVSEFYVISLRIFVYSIYLSTNALNKIHTITHNLR